MNSNQQKSLHKDCISEWGLGMSRTCGQITVSACSLIVLLPLFWCAKMFPTKTLYYDEMCESGLPHTSWMIHNLIDNICAANILGFFYVTTVTHCTGTYGRKVIIDLLGAILPWQLTLFLRNKVLAKKWVGSKLRWRVLIWAAFASHTFAWEYR